ncbi:MAG: hypothetical protein QME32_01115 [Endomicrobiia bacterium]|nr:hypothetical protein [Endomicrobiia bacterium]
MNLATLIKHRLYTYAEFARYVFSRVTGRPAASRENNYWGYIASLTEHRKKKCPHTALRKVSATKFYCEKCGAEVRYIREELSIAAEITTVLLAAALVYKLFKKPRSTTR